MEHTLTTITSSNIFLFQAIEGVGVLLYSGGRQHLLYRGTDSRGVHYEITLDNRLTCQHIGPLISQYTCMTRGENPSDAFKLAGCNQWLPVSIVHALSHEI